MIWRKGALALAVGVLGLASLAKADALAVYDFEDSLAANFKATNLNANSVSFVGTTWNSDTKGDTSTPTPDWGLGANGTANSYRWSTSSVKTFDSTKYITFTLTPQNGASFKMDTFSFRTVMQGVNAPESYALRSGRDNYASDLGSGVVTKISTGPSSGEWELKEISLPDSFDAITSAVTFRLYFWNANGDGASGNNRVYVDKVTVSEVPEPATALLAALGLPALLRRRRN